MLRKDSHWLKAGSPLLAVLEMALFLLTQLSFFALSFYRWNFSFLPDWKIIFFVLLGLAGYNHFPLLRSAMASKNLRRNLLVFALIFALLALTRLAQFKYSKAFLNSDRQVTSLMTRHIDEHKSRPIYFYGQLYQGCLNAYLYALTYQVVPDLQIAITLTNLLVFALAVLFANLVINKFVTVPPLYYFLFMTSMFASLYYISLDTTRGFQLWALLFFLMLYFCYQAIFEKKNRFLVCGFLGGLLFYHYQPSALVIFFLLLWVFWQKKSLPTAFFIAMGFLAGCFPHFLSEIQNHFYNSKFLLFQSEARVVALKNFLPIFFFPAHDFNNLVLPPISAYLFDLLFVLGFGHCLIAYLKTRSGKFLFLPLVYLVITVGLFLSGIVPQESRYRAHFVVYSILAAQFMTMPFFWRRFFPGKIGKTLFVAALCLFNAIAIADFVRKRREPHLQNSAAIKKIVNLNETIILGNYWDTMRFAPFAQSNKIIVTAPSLRDPNVFNPNTVKYLPSTLALAAGWDEARSALLIKANVYKYAAQFLRALAVDCKTIELNDNLLLVYDFSRKLSPELAALLSSNQLKYFADIAASIPAPGTITSVSLANGVLHLEATMSDRQREVSPFHKIVLKHACLPLQLEIPFAFHGGVMDWRLFDAVSLPGGQYALAVAFLNFPLFEQQMEIGTAATTASGSTVRIAFSRLSPLKKVMVWNPAANREEKIAGFPAAGFSCTILDKNATALQISLFSLLDFQKPDWYNYFQQELLVTRNHETLRFPLRFGPNLVAFPVRYGDHITLTTRHVSFFRGQAKGSAAIEYLEFIKTGAMLQEFSLTIGPRQDTVKLLPQLTEQ